MTLSALAVDTLYTVAPGDSLSKLAARFYGDANQYQLIATKNGISPQTILTIGQRIVLPAAPVMTMPAPIDSPEGRTLPTAEIGPEVVTVTASVWYKDWRYWAAIGAGAALLYFVTRRVRS